MITKTSASDLYPEASRKSADARRESGTSAAVIPLENGAVTGAAEAYEAGPLSDLIAEMGLQGEVAEARRDLAACIDADAPAPTLRALRLMAGLSQADFADRLGTSQPHISAIERGRQEPLITLAARWGEELGVDVNTFHLGFQAARRGR